MNNLQPFFERANSAIRSVDDTTIVFWEPVTYGYFLPVSGGLPISLAGK